MAELQPVHHEQERLRSAIPEEMQQVDSWVYWKLVTVHDRPVKMPFSPLTGEAASTVHPETWGTFEDALTAYTQAHANGVGFVFSSKDNFTGIDLDHCINTGNPGMSSDARGIVKSLNSYTELSPSGTGVHIIVEGHVPQGRRKDGVEIYSDARYFTVTGKRLLGSPDAILPRQDALDDLYHTLDPKPLSNPLEMRQGVVYELRSDEEVLRRAMNAKNGSSFSELWSGKHDGFSSKSHADFELLLKLGYWTNFDASQMERLFLQSGLCDEKTLSKRGNTTYLEYTIQKILNQHGK